MTHAPTTAEHEVAPRIEGSAARPRVLHVTNVDLTVRFLLLNQLHYLQARGYDAAAVCSPGPWIDEVEERGVRVHQVLMTRRMTPGADLRALLALVALFRRERPDIVHTHTPKAALLGQYAGRIARVPRLVHTIHGLYLPGHMTARARPFFLLLERAIMQFADAVLSQNREDVSTAIREGVCRADRISYLGNGIDLAQFDPAAVRDAERRRLRAELGLEAGHVVIGMVGRLVREKGYLEFFAAARALHQQFPEARFLVVGPLETEKRDALGPETARSYGLGEEIQFLGMRSDMPGLYTQIDVLVLPSHREGFPRVPMEAAAMGVPTIATNIRGCREVVVPGETGLLVPPRDPRALAAALGRLLRELGLRRAMGEAARRRALAQFDERVVFARVADTYQRLAISASGGARLHRMH